MISNSVKAIPTIMAPCRPFLFDYVFLLNLQKYALSDFEKTILAQFVDEYVKSTDPQIKNGCRKRHGLLNCELLVWSTAEQEIEEQKKAAKPNYVLGNQLRKNLTSQGFLKWRELMQLYSGYHSPKNSLTHEQLVEKLSVFKDSQFQEIVQEMLKTEPEDHDDSESTI